MAETILVKKLSSLKPLKGRRKSRTSDRLETDAVSADGIRADEFDGKIAQFALSGKLNRAAKQAVRDQRSRGLAITFKRGNQIVRQGADGSILILQTIEPVEFVAPPHVRVFRK
jgi:hypothetical protein